MVPQRPFKLRKLVHCPMCVRLWTERTLEAEESNARQAKVSKRKAELVEQLEERTDMAKIKKAKKSNDDDRRGRKVFEFVKVAKGVEEGTIMGIVHDAIKKVKSGTVAEITEAAVKGGLKDVTGQDPMVQTGVMLNRLKHKGAVRKVKADGSTSEKKVTLKLKKKKAA